MTHVDNVLIIRHSHRWKWCLAALLLVFFVQSFHRFDCNVRFSFSSALRPYASLNEPTLLSILRMHYVVLFYNHMQLHYHTHQPIISCSSSTSQIRYHLRKYLFVVNCASFENVLLRFLYILWCNDATFFLLRFEIFC